MTNQPAPTDEFACSELREPSEFTRHPEMLGTHYGIAVSTFGDGGDWIALGHVPPARFLVAVRREGRAMGMWEWSEFSGGDVEFVQHLRAVFRCEEGNPRAWYGWCGTDAQSHPEAIDVTMWRD